MEYKKIQKERRRSFSRLVFCKPSHQSHKRGLDIQGLAMDMHNTVLLEFS